MERLLFAGFPSILVPERHIRIRNWNAENRKDYQNFEFQLTELVKKCFRPFRSIKSGLFRLKELVLTPTKILGSPTNRKFPKFCPSLFPNFLKNLPHYSVELHFVYPLRKIASLPSVCSYVANICPNLLAG